MIKKYSQFIAEATDDKHAELHKFASDTYQEVAYDLPKHGNHHYDSAHDHIADRLYDKFHQTHPKANFGAIAKRALKPWVHDDRKESRANDKKRERKWEAEKKAREKPSKPSKAPEPYWKKAGYSTPMSKPRKGIGSY